MTTVPAAQYLRVSTERQEYSLDCPIVPLRTGEGFRRLSDLPFALPAIYIPLLGPENDGDPLFRLGLRREE